MKDSSLPEKSQADISMSQINQTSVEAKKRGKY